MPDSMTRILKILCLGLFAFVGFQVFKISKMYATSSDSEEIQLTFDPNQKKDSFPKGEPKEEVKREDSAALKVLVTSKIFGAEPPPPPPEKKEIKPPKLIGLLDRDGQPGALLRLEGETHWLVEKEEKNGIKVIEIGINRAKIEFGGATHDLTIFSGIESQ